MSGLLEIDRAATPSAREARPRLLFLGQTLPFPPDGGVNIRSYHIMRLLARHFDVTALCFYRKGSRPSPASVQASLAGLREIADVEAFPIPQEHSRFRYALDHMRSVAAGRAYTRYAYASTAFARRLRALLQARGFDLVHMDSLDLSGYLPLLDGLPVVCTHHNVESLLLSRRARVESSIWKRTYMKHQAKLTGKEERRWCSRVALNVVVSTEDARALAHISARARVAVVPNGVDTAVFQPGPAPTRGLVFVGGHGWFPNRDAMMYFTAEILPLLRSNGAAIDVTWVGRSPVPVQAQFQRMHGVTVTGYVDDVRPYVQAAACYIVPMRAGGGTRLKILDAWAMGKAVVSTSIGCEGLAAEDGRNILIRDNAHDFAEAVRMVLRDDGLRARLGQAARETALRIYDWEVIGASLLREYRALAQHPRQPSHP